ncbi:urease accessory protein UreD [Noviherbaspirillum massiliense]|uniref:urease accessory protein UreD n=1 Tax=Noviherbaspirillum massiliense TaxID=1465823 RepID=UPI0003012336|nr:urease accessory protein UreD [Noviherbaspirillum massiliense]
MKRFDSDSSGNHSFAASCAWQASLKLAFANDEGVTRMVGRSHVGPLRVQKPLYPEGGDVCHAVVVHPPGGVVGGDELGIAASLKDGARAFITTPGAAKWYRANGRVSRQDVRLELGARAALEWLPQETIFFNGAHVRLDHSVALAGDAAYIGWEILCFGRTASGEAFNSGRIEQRTSIRRDGRLLWFEQGALDGGSASMHSPLALGCHTVCATLIAVGAPIAAATLKALREEAEGGPGQFGMTQMKSVLVARHLGNSSEAAKNHMMRVWQRIRPELMGRSGFMPRIWNT